MQDGKEKWVEIEWARDERGRGGWQEKGGKRAKPHLLIQARCIKAKQFR